VISKKFSSEGIVLKRINFSEADRIIDLYSKDFGKISLLAKGVRKPKSRKRGSLEIFTYLKFQAARGKGLDFLEECEIIDTYSEIRKNLNKVTLAYYFMEVLSKLIYGSEKNEELFHLILKYFNVLKSTKGLKELRISFIYDLLTLFGFWPKGKIMSNPDEVLEEVIERKLNSVRIGKQLIS
jgi:DNA repair protein RecO (recombination protein O)